MRIYIGFLSAYNAGDLGWFQHWEDPLEKGKTTHSSILAWRIPWTEEPDGLQSLGSKRARQNWITNTFTLSLATVPRKFWPRSIPDLAPMGPSNCWVNIGSWRGPRQACICCLLLPVTVQWSVWAKRWCLLLSIYVEAFISSSLGL